MKLEVFQSDKGDCLLLESPAGTRILADGGMYSSFSTHVAPALGTLHGQGETLDVVYVSHIDQDHISGILQLTDDLLSWRVFEFQKQSGHPNPREPKVPRPPEIGEVWHNAFHEQIRENSGAIGDMLAAQASFLSGLSTDVHNDFARYLDDLATSKREAIILSRRIGARQLKIPLNRPSNGNLMMVRDAKAFRRGDLRISILGPFESDLKKLRKDWNDWLRNNQDALRRIRREARENVTRLRHARAENELVLTMAAEAHRLESLILAGGGVLGDRRSVTTPNLASLMLLVERGGKQILLTGDGHGDDILKGLKHHKKLDGRGGIHVDVLKVQHHGSEHNMDLEFAQKVTADHYIFCGNGAHHNPDLGIVEAIIDSRIGPSAKRTKNKKANNRPLKLWFNSSSKIAGNKKNDRKHMSQLETLVSKREKQSRLLKSSFMPNGKSQFTLLLP